MTKETLNGTFIHVKIGNALILCIYYPPSCLTDLDTGLEEIFLKCIISCAYDLMVIGDLNAKRSEWEDRQRSANEQKHKEFMEAFELNRYDIGGWPLFIKSMTRSQDGWSNIDHVLPNNNLLYDWVKE